MISEAVRKEVMERDNGECQFWHRQPVPATEISHFDHQGLGGLPPDHWKNQAPNLAASCGECHRKFSGPGPVYTWNRFKPYFSGSYGGVMLINDPSGELVPAEDLWFYMKHETTRLQKVEARIQGLAMIEGDVARDLYELSKGYKLLEPDAQSFAQYIAGRNVDANRAQEAARAYGWMDERGLAWPAGLTAQKADIIRKALEGIMGTDDHLEKIMARNEAQTWLDAAVDQSVSDLKQELIDAGLMKATVRWYAQFRLDSAPRKDYVIPPYPQNKTTRGLLTLIWARSVEDVLLLKEPGDIVIRSGKFVAGLNWDRKTKVLSDRDGNEVPYKDLT